ncbi:MAG TPA: PDZ domain-containing protein, partial [Blastocatellia bacterium]|nr:PDZ domain-containing protein [Blastocatellia bacterium]
PAAKAGLQSGDVIVAVNGKPVRMPRELTNAVASQPVGASVQVEFIRKGERLSVTVELAERPSDLTARTVEPDGENDQNREGDDSARLGVNTQTVTPAEADRMSLKVPSGALVLAVQPGSPASRVDIRHGDVIHRVGSREIKSSDDLAEAVRALKPGEQVALQIERRGQMVFVNVTVD